jgi:N utilization substance protein B
MPLPKQKFREIVYLALFSLDTVGETEDDIVNLIMEELKVTKKQGHEGFRKALKIFELKEELDKKVAEGSTEYELDRIPFVERNILRMGVFELFHENEVPPLVAIAEAIRLSRKFSSPESSSFVNAVLDTLHKKYGRE